VTRIDRLARSMKDFVTILSDLKARGVGFRCTEQAIDTSGAAGELTMNILAAAAQFETQLRRERQMEGIVKAKAEGVYKGRKPSIDRAKVLELKAAGKGPTAIARELGCDPSNVHRHLAVA
jgi:DNA invertase Pin-like site-specific DNA recombinase